MKLRLARFAIAVGLHGCGGPVEAPRVELPVVVDASGITTVETNLGDEVEVTEARLVVEDIAFTIAGEAHTASSRRKPGLVKTSTMAAIRP